MLDCSETSKRPPEGAGDDRPSDSSFHLSSSFQSISSLIMSVSFMLSFGTGDPPDASVSGEEPGARPGPFKSSGTRSANTVHGFVADLTGRCAAS